MNTLMDILQRIRAAILGSSTDARAARLAPVKVKLAGRNGYGNDHVPPPEQ